MADGPSKLRSDLKSRVTFAAHDFVTEPPEGAKGADVEIFYRVFHDWSEKSWIEILRCLRPALKYGARILINEVCLAEPNILPIPLEKKLRSAPSLLQVPTMYGTCILIYHRTSDLGMMAMLNAKERGRDGWATLYQTADESFRFLGVGTPPGSQLAYIEAIWEGS